MDQNSEKSSRPVNRKLNSLLFIIGATALNLVIMVSLFAILALIYGRFLASNFDQEASQIIIVLIFFLSVAGSYFFYHFFVKWLSHRVDMEKYFDPIFRFKGRKK